MKPSLQVVEQWQIIEQEHDPAIEVLSQVMPETLHVRSKNPRSGMDGYFAANTCIVKNENSRAPVSKECRMFC